MRIKGIVIDPFKFKREYDCEFETSRVEGMYYKVWKRLNASTYANEKDSQLIPVAYVFPERHTETVIALLKELSDARKVFEDIQSRIFYREFPKYRD